MHPPDVVVLGGGLAGMAAAWRLARSGASVTLVEKHGVRGGLARSFVRDGRHYPLGYHQILEGDLPLLSFMERLGLMDRIQWTRTRFAFHVDGRAHRLDAPLDFAKLPLSKRSKLGILKLMLRARWMRPPPEEMDAGTWVDRLAGPVARTEFFDRLCHLKFGLPAEELSAGWLRQRLVGEEASGRFGYVADGDWTHILVAALSAELESAGVTVLDACALTGVGRDETGRIATLTVEGGTTLRPRHVLSTLPLSILCRLVPGLEDPAVTSVRYSGVVSCVLATDQELPIPHYWTNILRPYRSFGGVFRLDLLNPTLGPPGQTILNLATHIGEPGEDTLQAQSDSAIVAQYLDDAAAVFGVRVRPLWTHVARLNHYSPVFVKGYQNPPPRSRDAENLWLAGNFRTCPTVASTGTAMDSGWETAGVLAQELGLSPFE